MTGQMIALDGGGEIEFAGVDLLDRTPVLDLKPYVARFDRPPGDGDPAGGWFDQVPMAGLDNMLDLYFQGNLDAAFAFGGQVAGRIDEIKPVAEIIEQTIAEFHEAIATLADVYGT